MENSVYDNSGMHQDMKVNAQTEVIKDDMGPWMLMNYRNKKKNADAKIPRKNVSSSSRFTVLQHEEVNEGASVDHVTTSSPAKNVPSVVKLWQSFQDKKKKAFLVSKVKKSNNATVNLKATTVVGTSSQPFISADVSSFSMKSGDSSRVSMKDVSNIGSFSGSKAGVHYQRKSKNLNASIPKLNSQVFKKLSFENASSCGLGDGISAVFGHCPPENPSLVPSKSLDPHIDSIMFVEKTVADNSILTNDSDLRTF